MCVYIYKGKAWPLKRCYAVSKMYVSENVLFTEGSNPYIERMLPYYFKGVDSRATTLIQEFRTIYLKQASQILRGVFCNIMYKAGRYFKA